MLILCETGSGQNARIFRLTGRSRLPDKQLPSGNKPKKSELTPSDQNRLSPAIIVTGASGRVGRLLIPILQKRGCRLLLVGRDIARLHAIYAGLECRAEGDLPNAAAGFDLVLHLAALNNDSDAPAEAFHAANVDGTLISAERARAAGVPRFFFCSSVLTFDASRKDAYTASKREAAARLQVIRGIDVTIAHLATVHGETFTGRLERLNALPRWLRGPLFAAASSLKPTLDAKRLAEAVIAVARRPVGTGNDTVILSDGQHRNTFYRLLRRLIDLSFCLGVALSTIALIPVALAIRLDSPGPALFRQDRIGRGGKVFTCYKFRTMRTGTEQAASHKVPVSAVTRLGAILRKLKIDELPQAINVLRNEMSLVGPRPCLPSQTELIDERARVGVLALKPGITGYAQVRGIDMSDPPRLAAIDAEYGALQGLLLDLRILRATFSRRAMKDRTTR